MNKRGLSRLEAICISGIVVILIIFAIMAVKYYHSSMARGDDALMVNTAKSVARVNQADDKCVVNGCTGNRGHSYCDHYIGDGCTMGYYEPVSKKIVADKITGYNEHTQPNADDKLASGKRGTMNIRIVGTGDSVKAEWVEGEMLSN